MRGHNLGKHLYAQIAGPLVIASLVVAVVATAMAFFFLGNLTNDWVDEVAQASADNLEARFDLRAQDMSRVAKLVSDNSRLKSVLEEGDSLAARGIIVQNNVALRYDNLMLLDQEGMIVATTGLSGIMPGDRPLGERSLAYAEIAMPHRSLLLLDGRQTLTAFQPVSLSGGGAYTLAVSELIDDDYIAEIAGGTGDAIALFDSEGVLSASTLSASETLRRLDVAGLEGAVREPAASISSAIGAASEGNDGIATLELGSANFRVRAREVRLAEDPGDEAHAHLVTIVSQALSDGARRTTVNLIAMWSVIAVLALVGLGGWVARRVSSPLSLLTAGARRVADGDFSTKIHVEAASEVADLADSFNVMTDSLRDRSESLTKKVLELATLYEMSRSLGATLDLDVLLEGVLDSALRIFDVDSGYVTLRESGSGDLQLKAWRGGSVRPDEDALRTSMSEWVVREGRPLIFNPTGDSGGRESQVDSVTGALAALCVPLVSSDGTLGAIAVGSHDSGFRFSSEDVRLLATIANHVTIAIGNIELFSSLQEAYLSTVRSLAAAVDAKDAFTRGHSDRVATYSTAIAERLGLSHDQRVALEMAAYLHDIGKIGVSEEILLKPGALSESEMREMRHHPLIGANILKPVGFPWPITPIVRHHHERWDGAGYPAGLRAEEIPLLARILSVADAFEAMIADRPYRSGRTMDDAIDELNRCSGSQFDPRIVDAFIEIIREHAHEWARGEVASETPQPEEARAIFVAICDGMLASFRKLGGPRLAVNVEQELNSAFSSEKLPFKVTNGHMVCGNGQSGDRGDLDGMRRVLQVIDEAIGRTSGHALVDHFYADALAALSERMRQLAVSLEFYSNSAST